MTSTWATRTSRLLEEHGRIGIVCRAVTPVPVTLTTRLESFTPRYAIPLNIITAPRLGTPFLPTSSLYCSSLFALVYRLCRFRLTSFLRPKFIISLPLPRPLYSIFSASVNYSPPRYAIPLNIVAVRYAIADYFRWPFESLFDFRSFSSPSSLVPVVDTLFFSECKVYSSVRRSISHPEFVSLFPALNVLGTPFLFMILCIAHLRALILFILRTAYVIIST